MPTATSTSATPPTRTRSLARTARSARSIASKPVIVGGGVGREDRRARRGIRRPRRPWCGRTWRPADRVRRRPRGARAATTIRRPPPRAWARGPTRGERTRRGPARTRSRSNPMSRSAASSIDAATWQVERIALGEAGALRGHRGRERREGVEAVDGPGALQRIERLGDAIRARARLLDIGPGAQDDPLPGPAAEQRADVLFGHERRHRARSDRHERVGGRRPPDDRDDRHRQRAHRQRDERARPRRRHAIDRLDPARGPQRRGRTPLEPHADLRRHEDDRDRRQHLARRRRERRAAASHAAR